MSLEAHEQVLTKIKELEAKIVELQGGLPAGKHPVVVAIPTPVSNHPGKQACVPKP